MYIITSKNNNSILGMGNKLDYLENGYPWLTEEDIAFPVDWVNIYKVETIGEEIEKDKYCYTEDDGFFINPNWVDINPYGIRQEKYTQIIDDYTLTLIEQGIL